jgi:hypothetical protein
MPAKFEPPLAPKPLRPITILRLQIKAGGYDVIPVRENKKGITGWPHQPNDETAIRRWGGLPATGIRMFGNDPFVIDLDITNQAIRDEILAAYEEKWPEFMRGCLRRHSGAIKIALIGRCVTAKKSRKTHRFYAGPDDTSKGQLVETFGRADKRLMVVQGVHSAGREYGYLGRPIWETPLDELPWFPDEDIFEALDIAEAVMKRHGLEKRRVVNAASGARDIYDLTPDMVMTLSDGETVKLGDLENNLSGYEFVSARRGGSGDVRGYATLWDRASTTPNRVRVLEGRTGLVLHDFKEGINHRWKDREPPPDDAGEKLRELLKSVALAWETQS